MFLACNTSYLSYLPSVFEGPISATLVIKHNGEAELSQLLEHMDWSILFFTDIHILWNNNKGHYPVNIARNIAMEKVRTKRLFLLDVDFFPHPQIREFIRRYSYC